MMRSGICGAILAVLMVAAATGCGRSKEAPTSSQPTRNQSASDIQVVGTNLKMRGGGNGVTLPADFPSDVPIYAGASVRFTAIQGVGENAGGIVSLETSDTAEKVGKFYQEELKQQAWTEASSFSSQADGKTGLVLGVKKDQRVLALNVAETKENKTVITITLKGK